MTNNKELCEAFTEIKSLVKHGTFEEDVENRLKNNAMAVMLLEVIEKSLNEIFEKHNKFMQAASEAANVIKEQNEWLKYIDIALGKNKEYIYSIAAKEKEAVEYYKDKNKKE